MGLGSLESMAHGAIRPCAPCATTPVLTEADGKVALTQPALVDTKSLDSKTEVYLAAFLCRVWCFSHYRSFQERIRGPTGYFGRYN